MFIPDPLPIPPSPPPIVMPPVFVPPPPDAGLQPLAWGTNVKFVVCAACGRDFCYRLSRTVSAGSRERAEARVRTALQLDIDPVPCPSCGAYQPDMVQLLQRRHLHPLRLAGFGLLAAGTDLLALAFGLGWTGWSLLAALPAVGLGLLLLRFALVRRFDPNAPAGTEARRAAGKQAEVVLPTSAGNGPGFVVAPDGTVTDVRYLSVHSTPAS